MSNYIQSFHVYAISNSYPKFNDSLLNLLAEVQKYVKYMTNILWSPKSEAKRRHKKS